MENEETKNKGLMDAYEALSRAGDDMVAAFEKNSQGYGYKYASLQQFTGTVRRVLASRGLVIVQPIDYVDGEQILRTQIYYKGWHEPIVSSVVPLREYTKLADDDVAKVRVDAQRPHEDNKRKQTLHPGQKQGAGITYARKYAIQAILCLAPDETDFDLDDPRIAPQAAQRDAQKKETQKKETPKKEVVVDPEREKMLEGIRTVYRHDKGTIEAVLGAHGLTTIDLKTCKMESLREIYAQIDRGDIS